MPSLTWMITRIYNGFPGNELQAVFLLVHPTAMARILRMDVFQVDDWQQPYSVDSINVWLDSLARNQWSLNQGSGKVIAIFYVGLRV